MPPVPSCERRSSWIKPSSRRWSTSVARVLGKTQDAEHHAQLAERIRRSFNDHFYKGDGLYSIGSQAAQSCALVYDLAEPGERQQVLAQLLASIERACQDDDPKPKSRNLTASTVAWPLNLKPKTKVRG